MIESVCMCEVVLKGDDMDSLVADGVDHWESSHPEFGLTPVSIRNYLESERRIDGPTERLAEIGEIVISPVSADLGEEIIEFFDRRVFAGNPAWGMCYCMFHHLGGRYSGDWPNRTWQENRRDLERRVDSGATTGVVAHVDGVLAGWCNASGRSAFPSLADGEDDAVGSIVCFAVAPPYRGHGVSRAMLDGALELLRSQGRTVAEAYPVDQPEDGATAYVGTLALYESAGFDVVSEEPLVVRRRLG
ncbi:MAG: GNAT family N-acetyltransferase [Acidimicrobiia bacterium]